MTNVILGILGIILSAAAALITIDYGGDYYVDGQHSADAAVVMHAAQNIQAAFDLHVMRYNAEPTSPTDLVSTPTKRAFLTSMPTLRGNGQHFVGWGTLFANGKNNKVFYLAAVPTGVCRQINKRANNFQNPEIIPTVPPASAANPATPYREGCYNQDGGQPEYANLYYRYMTYGS